MKITLCKTHLAFLFLHGLQHLQHLNPTSSLFPGGRLRQSKAEIGFRGTNGKPQLCSFHHFIIDTFSTVAVAGDNRDEA